ncbi:MAG: lipoyl synthase [Deltaproteobacteria bacterium]|nr:lipoyl synthase [Deltaproteobacteria bacterium]
MDKLQEEHPNTGKRPCRQRKPPWLKKRMTVNGSYGEVLKSLRMLSLHTVCQEARCPNHFECFSEGTATFMILGDRCTRNCGFCAVQFGSALEPDPTEPLRVAEAVRRLGLAYVVITSVTRDDLPDGGAGHFAATVGAIRGQCPGVSIEVLIPDLQGDRTALETVLDAQPQVLNHNVETVPRIYPTARPQAVYGRSVELLRRVGETSDAVVKSGFMVGLGETESEVTSLLLDLREAGCDIVTIGQYLSPSASHIPVVEYIPPEQFERYAEVARDIGIPTAASGPFVRSSYRSRNLLENTRQILRERSLRSRIPPKTEPSPVQS